MGTIYNEAAARECVEHFREAEGFSVKRHNGTLIIHCRGEEARTWYYRTAPYISQFGGESFQLDANFLPQLIEWATAAGFEVEVE